MLPRLDSSGVMQSEVISLQTFFEAEALVHLDVLLKTAIRTLRSVEEGQDVVQETYLRAWKHFGSYQRGSNCRGWLFRIMFNVMNDRRGKQARRTEVPLEENEEAGTRQGNVLVFDPLAKLEGGEVLEAANLLSEEHRSVLSLVVIEEFSYREAGEILGVPIGTVMSRLHRARKELKKIVASRSIRRARPRSAARAAGNGY